MQTTDSLDRGSDVASGAAEAAAPVHSPLPWSVEDAYGLTVHGSKCVAYITAPNDRGRYTNVADICDSYNITTEQARGNAALIVRAVNSHADLLAALIEMKAMHEAMMDCIPHGECWYSADTLRMMNEAPIHAHNAVAKAGAA